MKQGTIPRVQLARKLTELPPHQINRWVLTGTPVTEPYPCTCRYDPCRYLKCPDRYRTEGEELPWGCCGRAGHDPVADKLKAAPVAAGFVQAPDRRTSWERRFPTTSSPPVAEAGLWDTGAAEEPPLAWDAIDEVSGSHGERLEDAFGHLDTLGHLQGAEDEAEELWRAEVSKRRAGVAAGHCDCPTPWDTDPPSLLWAAGPKATAPEQVVALSAKPGADARADADTAIELAGDRRTKPWREARHALLPPLDSKTKTRPCWLAPLASGRVAVIDLPPEPRGGGVHCPDCHNSFASAGAYEMHRPKRPGRPAGVCVPPGSVKLVKRATLALRASASGSETLSIASVEHGGPLLKRDLAGVWSVDKTAVWGPEGPPQSGAGGGPVGRSYGSW